MRTYCLAAVGAVVASVGFLVGSARASVTTYRIYNSHDRVLLAHGVNHGRRIHAQETRYRHNVSRLYPVWRELVARRRIRPLPVVIHVPDPTAFPEHAHTQIVLRGRTLVGGGDGGDFRRLAACYEIYVAPVKDRSGDDSFETLRALMLTLPSLSRDRPVRMFSASRAAAPAFVSAAVMLSPLSPGASLPIPLPVLSDDRWAATATRLPDGRVLVAGGYSFAKKDTLRSADLWDPKTAAVTPAAPMNEDRNFATATLLPNGKVLVAGGFSEKRFTLDKAEVYDPAKNVWEATLGRLNDRRELFTATPLDDGRVLLVGGLSLKKRTTLLTAETYDPKTNTFTATPGLMTDDRFGHAAARLPDGRVLVVGGKSWRVGEPDRTLATAELFDPKTGLFTPTNGPLKIARDRPTATLLSDGRVLVAGGAGKGASAMMAEIFDPKTGLFMDAAPLVEGRMAHDACLLPDGRVLVAGGWCDARKATTPTAEIFDPKTNRWTPALPDLPFAAHDLVLVPLPNGTVLAVGGKVTNGDEKTAASVDRAVLLAPPPR